MRAFNSSQLAIMQQGGYCARGGLALWRRFPGIVTTGAISHSFLP